MSEQPKFITRGELYEEIWRTPMSKLASAWGVSFSSIAKACIEMRVPRPASNHWHMVMRGRLVVREPLPAADAETPSNALLPLVQKAEVVGHHQSDDPHSQSSKSPAGEQQSNELSVEMPGVTGLLGKQNALAAFDKLQEAFTLIQKALSECPSFKVLDLAPMLRSLAEDMRILAIKDSELDLRSLMLKHEWRIGDRFYVRARVLDASAPSFTIVPGQDLPEGVVVSGHLRKPVLQSGQMVALDLEIRRRQSKAAWHFRAVAPE